ncbi:hypothetical protein MHM93_15325 [Pseudoalteromonas sp. MM17-2]|uniref:hypothetical protein n=1 Tax=Pseudoalteromonas sp. MM17-2 TaxID=2917753 RepID=UPI001EF5C58F|nr:hypothetical protein [Pseudoalteromonas sp. MM17-2]MCG7545553.1 hypothetical protein [Pseudoalteromonas sp. MM17-2]
MDQQNITTLVELIPAAAIAALVGSTLAFAGVVYTNRKSEKRMIAQHEHERRLKLRDIKIERAEELYVLLKHWREQVLSDIRKYQNAINENKTVEEATKNIRESREESNTNIPKTEALIALHFPSLKGGFEQVRCSNDKLVKLVMGYSESPNSRLENDQTKAELANVEKSLIDDFENMYGQLAELVHKL